ncbi:hypothetical protein AAMO2058_001381600 [Amorphochlora amoebiformis]
MSDLKYVRGFASELSSEALPGSLPKSQNNPKRCPYDLFAEQLSGTSFTTPRVHNQRIWFYRIMPSAKHGKYKRVANEYIVGDFTNLVATPERFRWKPLPLPDAKESVDFVQGLRTMGGAGSAAGKAGFAVHCYSCNSSMGKRVMCNSDGDFLIVPQLGSLMIKTECGHIHISPGEIAVIQRGFKFSVHLPTKGDRRGYICEVFDGHFVLPDLGPIGANGLANPRDFLHPTAKYENDTKTKHLLIHKFCGGMFEAELPGSPFDVVAWHGNYIPYKYNLKDFVAVNSVTVDHMDPSIFTVLTCQTNSPGVASCDFVIFPPRMAVQKNTFRPPYYHRNCMTEFMGNIKGQYDAKPDGFKPGGASLHSCMAGHGPDADTFEKCSKEKDDPVQMPEDSLAFMFESTYIMRLTDWALNKAPLDEDYIKCWDGLESKFDPNKP